MCGCTGLGDEVDGEEYDVVVQAIVAPISKHTPNILSIYKITQPWWGVG